MADYVPMLERAVLDKPVNKSEHCKALHSPQAGRSDGSIQFKHTNSSAALAGQGLPYIEGYKPRGNYQALPAKRRTSLHCHELGVELQLRHALSRVRPDHRPGRRQDPGEQRGLVSGLPATAPWADFPGVPKGTAR